MEDLSNIWNTDDVTECRVCCAMGMGDSGHTNMFWRRFTGGYMAGCKSIEIEPYHGIEI